MPLCLTRVQCALRYCVSLCVKRGLCALRDIRATCRGSQATPLGVQIRSPFRVLKECPPPRRVAGATVLTSSSELALPHWVGIIT